MSDQYADGEKSSSLSIAESRTHSRTRMSSLAYVELSDDNGGLILNISEDGLAVQAVQLVSPEQLSHMRFRLPKTSMAIEATGRLVWQLRSKKEAGIQFVGLSDEARDGIRQWIGAEASRAAAPPEPRQKTPQREKPAPEVQPEEAAPVSQASVLPAPEAPVGQVPAASAASAKTAKPKQSPLPATKPAAGASRIPNRPSPVPPAAPAPQFATGLPLPKESAPPNAEPQARPADLLSGRLPSAGSAFPAGRIPLRNAPRPDGFPVQPPMGTVPNIPSWNGYVAPGLGMRYRRPRRWWTYTAALGIIAAVGFAGLMMIDPSTISRARLATAAHQPDTTRNLPQGPLANNNTDPNASSNAAPITPALPNARPPAPAPDNSAATNVPLRHDVPQASGAGNISPGENSNAASNESATSKSHPNDSANSSAPSNSASAAKSTNDREASALGSERAGRSARSEASDKKSASASNPKANASSSSQLAEPKQTAPAASPNASSSTNGNEAQPSSPAPGTVVPPAPAPVTASPPSATQPSVQQKDQDDYARTAKREVASGPSGGAGSDKPPAQQLSATSPARGSSVVMSGEPSSPVPPSAPLVGVPSGSVGATSRFHSFRIPPELQSKAAQLAGSLQIGQILSSYSPSYPIEAARAGVEGIVKLDVMVAPNGNVENVTIVSGPPMLTAVSVSAVKQWHYGETLLGGQPVEAEQYVTLIFRLAK